MKERVSFWQVWGAVVAMSVVAELSGISQYLLQGARWGLQPVQQVGVRGVQTGIKAWESAWSLPKAAQKIQDLELRLAEASVTLGELEQLKKENEELRYLLENTDRTSEETQIVTPVLSLAQPALAGGTKQGIQQGSLIFIRDTLLGRVSEAQASFSKVSLLSEREGQLLLVETERGAQGVIRGDGQRVLLTEVPLDQEIRVGDRVQTSGQSDFPAGLFVGRVVQLRTEPADSIQTAVIEQYASFYESPIVEVR